MQEVCFWKLCFFRLSGQEPKLFGFSEFLAALALMVLAWTIADFRYRFRVRTAPIPLPRVTFWIVASVGVLTLATDLWRAERWYVPRGNLVSYAGWQTILGATVLFTFLGWSWFAFIRPQRFGKTNARRFATTIYHTIMSGNPNEIAIVADEIRASALCLVKAARETPQFQDAVPVKFTDYQIYVQSVLSLMGDRRFCRAVVKSSPGTILAFFDAIQNSKRYRAPLETFGNNIMNEAIMNPDSFAYHEGSGYQTGLMGFQRPISRAIYENADLVDGQGRLLDRDVMARQKWDASHWEAYSRFVLIALEGRIERKGLSGHSVVLYRAFDAISRSCADLYQINETESFSSVESPWGRLNVAVDTFKKAIEIAHGVDSSHIRLRTRERFSEDRSTMDLIAESIVTLIKAAATVRSPRHTSWMVQHNSVWGEFFGSRRLDARSSNIIKFKVRRLLFEEIKKLESFENYQSAAILGFLLNVLGLTALEPRTEIDMYALHIAVLRWTKRNFRKIYEKSQRLADACLTDALEFDEGNNRLIRYWGLNPADKSRSASLDLQPLPPKRKRRRPLSGPDSSA